MIHKHTMKRFSVVSGYRRTTPLWIPTCTCPTMGWSLLKRTWRWSAPARWTCTSSPSTHRDATSPLDLQYTTVREGVCVWRAVMFLPPPPFTEIFSPHLSVDEIRLLPFSNSSRATQFSREVMKTQGEWEFLQLSVTSSNFTFHERQWDQLIYTVRNSGTEDKLKEKPEFMSGET